MILYNYLISKYDIEKLTSKTPRIRCTFYQKETFFCLQTQLAGEAAKVAAAEQKKDEARVKLLQKARSALRKYHTNVNSLTDKDWGDVLRWVMPAAGVTVVLKNFKKKDVIIAKLQTLELAWTSFIPPEDNPDEPLEVAL